MKKVVEEQTVWTEEWGNLLIIRKHPKEIILNKKEAEWLVHELDAWIYLEDMAEKLSAMSNVD